MILVRVDDYPTGNCHGHFSPAAIEMFLAFDSLLRKKYGIPYLLAVVPVYSTRGAIRDTLDRLWSEAAGDIEVGTHGYDHIAKQLPHNEFAHKTAERVQEETALGMSILQEFNPRVFVAPFNRYTQDLLSCLPENGYKFCTAGPETGEHTLDYTNLSAVNSDVYGRSNEILPLVVEADPEQDIVLTLHWTWEIAPMLDGTSRLEELCQMIAPKCGQWKGWLDANS